MTGERYEAGGEAPDLRFSVVGYLCYLPAAGGLSSDMARR